MKIDQPRYIPLKHLSEKGLDFNLAILDDLGEFNFVPKRFYILSAGEIAVTRGNHAHLNQVQVLYLLSGRAHLNLSNKEYEIFEFELNKNAVYIPPNYWIELAIQPQSSVLCFASESFAKVKTLKKRQEFFLTEK